MSDGARESDPESPPALDSAARGRTGWLARPKVAAKQRYTGSAVERAWTRLSDLDFINRGMLLAAILLLCFFPFLIIINALAGRDAVAGLSRHLGLNKEAATDLSHLFTSTSATADALTVSSYVFFVLGAIAVAASLQELYESVFDLEHRGMKGLLRELIWLGVVILGSLLAGWLGPQINSGAGPILLGLVAFVSLTAFWWFTLWFLLSQRVRWRKLLPSATATALCWIGMEIVFAHIFSDTIISNNDKYGPIGIVFALMSWLIAIGVVTILGAVVGIVWSERTDRIAESHADPPR
jgi:membrane protein